MVVILTPIVLMVVGIPGYIYIYIARLDLSDTRGWLRRGGHRLLAAIFFENGC